jgi:tetratricopeptide (TPR) repeat protein
VTNRSASGRAAENLRWTKVRWLNAVLGLLLLAPVLLFAQSQPADTHKTGVHGANTHKADSAETLTRAESLMDQQQWPAAESLLREVVAADAKDTRAWFDLGYVMHAQKNYPQAIAAYRGAVAAEPGSFESNLNLGLMLAHEKQPEASTYLEAATKLKPTGGHPQESLAHAWAALAEVREAQSKTQTGAQTEASGKTQTALDCWRQAVELSPNHAPYRLAYGEALENSANASADTSSANTSSANTSEDASAKASANLLAAEAQFRKAAELAATSTDAGDSHDTARDALVALGNLLMRARRLPEAEATLSRLVTVAPQDESAHLQLGRVLSAEQKDTEATEELRKALALRPDDWDALRELAFVQERGKQFAAAESSYRALLAKFVSDAELHNGLGSVLLRQLKYAEAEREFIICIQLKPEWGEAYGQLALAASGNKDYAGAIKALDARKKLLPEMPSSYFLRATCYDHLRRYAEAVENYKAFLAASHGQFPDDEWKARHRLIAIEPEAKRQK